MGRMVSRTREKVIKLFSRPATIDDVAYIAARMRKEDREECFANAGSSPIQSLFEGYFTSKPCMTAISRHGYPMAMYGVSRVSDMSASIWMLGCENMLKDTRDKYEFLRQSRIELKKLQKLYPVLFNYIDARNTVHLRWLLYMGFTIIKKHEVFGYEGLPFYEFVKI